MLIGWVEALGRGYLPRDFLNTDRLARGRAQCIEDTP
jgi:hypothetical protein